ncbi:MAG: hypothetical protein IKG18_15805, partial [Atopobiaceae bacterium]|nr:hypothetical protein [Atopobiaceae bacterium]
MDNTRIGGCSRGLRKAISLGLAAAMAFGGVPAPALAEAASEVAAVRAQADRAGELADAVREAALGLDGMTSADKVSSIYALLANVPVVDSAEGGATTADQGEDGLKTVDPAGEGSVADDPIVAGATGSDMPDMPASGTTTSDAPATDPNAADAPATGVPVTDPNAAGASATRDVDAEVLA